MRSIIRSIIVALAMMPIALHAQVSNYKAYTLFIYNFTKYVQWPDGAIKDDFVIGVLGKSPITEELMKMSSLKKVGDKSIKVVEISPDMSVDGVHIIFIPDQKTNQFGDLLTKIQAKPILIVAEKEGLASKVLALVSL